MGENILELEEEPLTYDENDLVLEVKKAITINEGVHEGKIVKIVKRTTKKGYTYIDFYVSVDNYPEEDITLKFGFPAYLSATSRLGKFLDRMGVPLKPGDKVDLKGLIGKRVSYMTMTEEADGNTYSRVLPETVKPA